MEGHIGELQRCHAVRTCLRDEERLILRLASSAEEEELEAVCPASLVEVASW